MSQPGTIADLPDLAEIFHELRQGRHLCQLDGTLYLSLLNHQQEFKQIFAALGFELRFHTHEFFYFFDNSSPSDRINQIAVFIFILVEHLADCGRPVEETILTETFAIDELVHLNKERYKNYMAEAEIKTDEDLLRIIKNMRRLGFAEKTETHNLKFRPPIARFLDLCFEILEDEEGKTPTANDTAAEIEEPGELPQ